MSWDIYGDKMKNLGIIAVVVIVLFVALGIVGYLIISPLLATDFGGQWQQKITIICDDGTTEVIEGSSVIGTIFRKSKEVTDIYITLYINPENIDESNYEVVDIDFDENTLVCNYRVNEGGVQVYEKTGIELLSGDKPLSDIITYNFDSSFQKVGVIPIDITNWASTVYGDCELEIWYSGNTEYKTGFLNIRNGTLKPPSGTLTIDFESTGGNGGECPYNFDINFDGEIDVQDTAIVQASLNDGEQNMLYDVNCDGVINNDDITMIINNYGTVTLQLIDFSWDLGNWIHSIFGV